MSATNQLQLIELTDLNFSLIDSLADESYREGYLFIQRTISDWNNGLNTFSGEGEKLMGLVSEMELIGIGGLNCDPYTEDVNVGRVRHLYIRGAYRRKGYATLLMNTIIDKGRNHFNMLRLFTDNPAASEFYGTLGFQKIDAPKASHIYNFSTNHKTTE